ncbi:MAG: WG repeat-containing protein, partial [Myxococcales bacterium]
VTCPLASPARNPVARDHTNDARSRVSSNRSKLLHVWRDSPAICGYIDEGGSEVFPLNFSTRVSPYFVEWQEDHFSYLGNFHRGLAPAAKAGAAVGYIDLTGAWAIEPRFSNAREFSDENLAPVALSAEHVLLDREGNIIANGDQVQARLDREP